MKKKITMQFIADSLGLSRNTVSKVLNGYPGVSNETKEKVIKKAIELNYKYFSNTDIEKFNGKETGNIALLTANMPTSSHYGTSFLNGFEGKIRSEGYNLSYYIIREAEINALLLPNSFQTSKIDGIICIELFDKNYIELINKLKIPTIFADTSADVFYPELVADIILMENEHNVYGITKKLIDKGYTNIGFVGDYNHCRSFYERWIGFNHALLDSNLQLNLSYCIIDDDKFFSSDWIGDQLDRMKSLPSAFFCANDFIAINVLSALKERNIKVPDDIVICGFDDSIESKIVEPSLTTVHIFSNEMGVIAAETILSRIKNPSRPPQIIHVKTEPIFRNSTGNIL
ncbi:LacI family DNA-binding transcriptional regulator [Thermoanaerobacterium thermosaccharolyticum]|jgi:LacI family transcriptional regulator|uniref:LacI family DNA-binding transcriptional regulator n=1 Tax=Thermoanaerobacterium thermosaccharolyticum TaxID=1517 RepID=UPI00177D6C60|nr:LacI family DNA-binding transcriptional regulator [Thermoanaerobacterium thermosaccharolyticum]MBE0067605.1 LacI family transcriptional regulator [Thermoanaerobacterium thermosaccharolyticum]MBE0227189.1 LacI family transcriptional regulator [Thermoanaerobacterium thermosaccharolyticum]